MLGNRRIPVDALWGIHALRASENFPASGLVNDPVFVRAFAMVKKACCLVNSELGFIDEEKVDSICQACDELIEGRHLEYIIVDPLSGGAGTSLNMNINEVIANRALELSGRDPGDYDFISPLEVINLHQSTNDVFPTALKVAGLIYLKQLEDSLTAFQFALQQKEKQFRSIVKIGRTEMQEAVPMTLGAEFSGFAELFAQDRWRMSKARERLRLINLGGTAVGTGLAAPRDFIFLADSKLRELTGLNLARAENPIYPTQNADSFCEVSGILKTYAGGLIKFSRDIRLLAVLGEILLEPMQAGSSIMPGKVNPVVCENVIQSGLRCFANDSSIHDCASRGTLQINEFLPLIAVALLENFRLLKNATETISAYTDKIRANETRCLEYVENSPVIMTAFLPELGYEKVLELQEEYKNEPELSVREFLADRLGGDTVDRILSAENLTRLGYDDGTDDED